MALTDCAECGRGIEEVFNFCPECGTELNVEACSECGSIKTADADVCPECGAGEKLTRGPEAEWVTDAVTQLDGEKQNRLQDLIELDPDIILAVAQLVRISPRPEEAADGLPEHKTLIRQVLSEADRGLTAREIAEALHETFVVDRDSPITETESVPDRIRTEWVESQLEELLEHGHVGRHILEDGTVRYTETVASALEKAFGLNDRTFEDVDRVVEETGMHRPTVVRRMMTAQYTELTPP
jgi:RNA polymerase subunit RPABC4/transcription elongation factor Spt4